MLPPLKTIQACTPPERVRDRLGLPGGSAPDGRDGQSCRTPGGHLEHTGHLKHTGRNRSRRDTQSKDTETTAGKDTETTAGKDTETTAGKGTECTEAPCTEEH